MAPPGQGGARRVVSVPRLARPRSAKSLPHAGLRLVSLVDVVLHVGGVVSSAVGELQGVVVEADERAISPARLVGAMGSATQAAGHAESVVGGIVTAPGERGLQHRVGTGGDVILWGCILRIKTWHCHPHHVWFSKRQFQLGTFLGRNGRGTGGHGRGRWADGHGDSDGIGRGWGRRGRVARTCKRRLLAFASRWQNAGFPWVALAVWGLSRAQRAAPTLVESRRFRGRVRRRLDGFLAHVLGWWRSSVARSIDGRGRVRRWRLTLAGTDQTTEHTCQSNTVQHSQGKYTKHNRAYLGDNLVLVAHVRQVGVSGVLRSVLGARGLDSDGSLATKMGSKCGKVNEASDEFYTIRMLRERWMWKLT